MYQWTDIIFNELSQLTKVDLYGPKTAMNLRRPELYTPETVILTGHLYVGTENTLPSMPQFSSGMLIICAGRLPSAAYTRENFPLIHVKKENLFNTFNVIQNIYARYEEWINNINRIADTVGDIAEIVKCSLPIFHNNPIRIVDKKLQNIIRTEYVERSDGRIEITRLVTDGQPMEQSEFAIYNDFYTIDAEKRGVFLSEHDIQKGITGRYCINLYSNDQYFGNISLICKAAPFQTHWKFCLEELSAAIVKALKIKQSFSARTDYSIQHICQEILDGNPISRRKIYNAFRKGPYQQDFDSTEKMKFLCLNVAMDTLESSTSLLFTCNLIEEALPGSIVFEYQNKIIGIVNLERVPYETETIHNILVKAIKDTPIRIGFSGYFNNLQNLRAYFRQAQLALTLSNQEDTEKKVVFFREHLYAYMLSNCMGEFRLMDICPRELIELWNMDKTSKACYWETLRTCLDYNFNYSMVARALYLHRSTLLVRINKISGVLNMDFNDSQTRVLLHIFVYLIDREKGTKA